MIRTINVELFVPEQDVSRTVLRSILDTMVRAGFVFEPEFGRGGRYWSNRGMEWQIGVGLARAIDAFGETRHWAIELSTHSAHDRPVPLNLSPERAGGPPELQFYRINMSTEMPDIRAEPMLSREFLASSTFLSELTHPWYGSGGGHLGLFNRETTPVSADAVAKLELQPIEWLNIFGPPYVRRLGLSRLLSVPAGRVQFLADGSIALILGTHPETVVIEDAARVARHLGLPITPFRS